MDNNTRRNKFVLFVQTLFGAVLAIKGFDGFVNFLPQADQTVIGMNFISAMKDTGYLFFLLKGTEILCGSLLIMNLFVPLTLVVLAPVIVNIFLFEVFLNFTAASLILPLVVSACEIYLFWHYRNLFSWLLKYQIHTDINSYENPEIIILSEVREKNPDAYNKIRSIEGIKQIITH